MNLRCSISNCFDKTKLLSNAIKDDHQILTSISYNNDNEQKIIVYRVNNDDFNNEQIFFRQIVRKKSTTSCSSFERLFKRQNINFTKIESAFRSQSALNHFDNHAKDYLHSKTWKKFLQNWNAHDEFNYAHVDNFQSNDHFWASVVVPKVASEVDNIIFDFIQNSSDFRWMKTKLKYFIEKAKSIEFFCFQTIKISRIIFPQAKC